MKLYSFNLSNLLVLIPYERLNDAGYQAGTAVGNLVREAGKFACNVMRNFPTWASRGVPFFPGYNQGFFESICTDPPLAPQIPAPPFQGGQCPIVYDVTHDALSGANLVVQTNRLNGPIYGIVITGVGEGNTVGYGIRHGTNQILGLGFVTVEAWRDAGGIPKIYSVVPVNGSDECGDPPPTLPPELPTPPEISNAIDVSIAPNVTINIPIVYIRPSLDVDLNLNIPVEINLAPTVHLPSINIGFSFGDRGVEVFPTLPPANDPRRFPLPDTRQPEPIVRRQPERDFSDLKKLLEDIKDCTCEQEGTLNSIEYFPSRSRTVNLPPRTKYCTLTLTANNTPYKHAAGINAPDVVYAGWCSFWIAGSPEKRVPIDYETNCYLPPSKDASKFSYTCRVGCEAILKVFFLT